MIYYFDLHRTKVFGPMFKKSGVVQKNHYRGFCALYAIRAPGLYRLPSEVFYPLPRFKDGDDKIIVFDSYSSLRQINWLCGKYPDKRIVFWYWNRVSNAHWMDQMPARVEKWSFSKTDCRKYGLRYNTQFFFDCLAAEAAGCRKAAHTGPLKALFLGRDKGRAAVLAEISKELEAAGVSVDLRITPPQTGRMGVFKESLTPYTDVIGLVKNTDILLDYAMDPDTGISMRAMEALFFGKKLITNNKEILQADFYSPSNIYVLGSDGRTLAEFVDSPLSEVDETILDNYLLSNWLRRFDG